MAADLSEQGRDLSVLIAKGTIALTLIDELAQIAEQHEANMREATKSHNKRTASLNEMLVFQMLRAVRNARIGMDDLADQAERYNSDDD